MTGPRHTRRLRGDEITSDLRADLEAVKAQLRSTNRELNTIRAETELLKTRVADLERRPITP